MNLTLKFHRVIIIFLILLSAATLARQQQSNLIRVPEDYPGIQEGINAAADGDTVLVADSTYFENINFKGKAITVGSYFIMDGNINHIANTVIDGSQPNNPDSGSVVYFVSGEDTNSVLCGFTITGGNGTLFGNNRGGGGIYCQYGATLIHNIVENNSLDFTGSTIGGGISAGTYFSTGDKRPVHILHNTVRNNSAISSNGQAFGGGVFFHADGKLIGNNISNNVVSYTGPGSPNNGSFGGGISCFWQQSFITVTIQDNIIDGNQALSTNTTGWGGYGGGVDLIWANSDLKGNTITENKVSGAPWGYGAGMRFLLSQSTSRVTGNTFANNKALNGSVNVQGGGLLTVQTENLTVEENIFQANDGFNGGGIYISSDVGITIRNNKILENAVSSLGGGVYVSNANPLLENNLIAGNTSVNGAGIRVFTSTSGAGENQGANPNPSILQAIAAGASVNDLSGSLSPGSTEAGSLLSEPQIVNNTIVNNLASSQGGAIYNTNSQTTVLNSILWGNTAPLGPQIQISGGSVTVEYSDVEGGWPGTGNLGTNPEFADTVDFYLSSGSACVDAGHPDPSYNDPESATNPGVACRPALGGLRNDMGTYGGPGVICDDSIIVAIDPGEPTGGLAERFSLYQNYPNPFNPFTNIRFRLPAGASQAGIADGSTSLTTGFVFTELKIYDVSGREIATLVSENLAPGEYNLQWNGRDVFGNPLSSGVYFYRLTAGSFTQTRKMILMR